MLPRGLFIGYSKKVNVVHLRPSVGILRPHGEVPLPRQVTLIVGLRDIDALNLEDHGYAQSWQQAIFWRLSLTQPCMTEPPSEQSMSGLLACAGHRAECLSNVQGIKGRSQSCFVHHFQRAAAGQAWQRPFFVAASRRVRGNCITISMIPAELRRSQHL